MSLDSKLNSWNYKKNVGWIVPLFLGVGSLWVGNTVGGEDGETAKILQGIYFATGVLCISLFCVCSLLIVLIEQGRLQASE